MKAYYIFNDLNLGPDTMRVQGEKKRFAYNQIKVYRLRFSDVHLTALEIKNKHFKIFKGAEELEYILTKRGAQLKELGTQQATGQPEEEESCFDGSWFIWDFEENFKLRLTRNSSHRNDSTIIWWNILFGPSGKKYVIDGENHPITNPVHINKIYEGDDVPSKEVMKKVSVEKPTPNWVIGIIVLLIFFIAAMIYSANY